MRHSGGGRREEERREEVPEGRVMDSPRWSLPKSGPFVTPRACALTGSNFPGIAAVWMIYAANRAPTTIIVSVVCPLYGL
jgi:hypothetical protein